MSIHQSLFEGERIRFTAIDHDRDAEIESRWTHDSEYMRLLSPQPMRPLSPAQVKKAYEAIEKGVEEERNSFYFALRTSPAGANPDGRLIGFARFVHVDWQHGIGRVSLGIGEAQDRGRGFGTEALRLLLRYGFTEINLYRLTADIPEYNGAALHLFRKAGFCEEVRRREALHRSGRWWERILMGILREEWQDA